MRGKSSDVISVAAVTCFLIRTAFPAPGREPMAIERAKKGSSFAVPGRIFYPA
jgi:hypothetical protein